MKYLNLNGYEIIPCGLKHSTHTLSKDRVYQTKQLTEEICKPMCTEHDSGDRYMEDSRYHYTSHLVKDYKGIHMMALPCVQESIVKYYGDGIRFIKIIDTNH